MENTKYRIIYIEGNYYLEFFYGMKPRWFGANIMFLKNIEDWRFIPKDGIAAYNRWYCPKRCPDMYDLQDIIGWSIMLKQTLSVSSENGKYKLKKFAIDYPNIQDYFNHINGDIDNERKREKEKQCIDTKTEYL